MESILKKLEAFRVPKDELAKQLLGGREQCSSGQVNGGNCTFVQMYPEGSVMMDCGIELDADGEEHYILCETYFV